MLKKLAFYFALLLFLLIIAYSFQRHLIYFPLTSKPDRKYFNALDMQIITLKPNENLTIESWYKPALKNHPTILYLHGNGGFIGSRMRFVRYFINQGFGVLLLEYRGYGGNSGRPTERGLYEDARSAIKFLNNKGIQDNNIVLYGESLGTGIATKLGTEFSPCAIILQSPFTSLKDLAQYHYPYLPSFVQDKYDSLSRITKIKSPILMLHGTSDTVVPYNLGLELFNKANEPKEWVKVEGRDHNNLWDDNFANIVIQYIDKKCVLPEIKTKRGF